MWHADFAIRLIVSGIHANVSPSRCASAILAHQKIAKSTDHKHHKPDTAQDRAIQTVDLGHHRWQRPGENGQRKSFYDKDKRQRCEQIQGATTAPAPAYPS